MSEQITVDRISEIASDFLKNKEGMYLVEVNIRPGNIISVEIDNDNGVKIDECIELSRHIDSFFNRDEEDYELTVTSSGISDPFKNVRQYRKNLDKEVEVLSKKGEKLKGILTDVDDDGFSVTIKTKVKEEGKKRKTEVDKLIRFSYDEIKYVKPIIRF